MSKKKSHKEMPLEERSRYFINRELSWLAFNTRVLEEAENKNTPLLERLKFLSISAANLDEFAMIRIAGLKDQLFHESTAVSNDGLTPAEQLAEIRKVNTKLIFAQQECWINIKHELKSENIHVLGIDDLSLTDKAWLKLHFIDNIFPALTPIAIDPAHPFPFLPNLGLTQVYELKEKKKGKTLLSVLPIPHRLPRFIRLEGEPLRFILLEEIIEYFLETLFPGYEKTNSTLFRIIRDSDLDVEEQAEDLMRYYERAIKERRRGRVIRVKALSPVIPSLLDFFTRHIAADAEDVIEVTGLLGIADLEELYDRCDRPDLKYKPYDVRYPERIADYHGDCFAAIKAKDIIIHHPFESFDVVVQFLRQAAMDPEVVSIKQTLYRTSHDSPIVKALIEAAENGKSVTALVELKARFDEEANIRWARDLERAGVQVVFGFVNLKTHAKMSLISRREEGKLQSYAHFGTGNYHPNTAKVYTDLSFFTCDEILCRDATFVFNFVTGYGQPESFEKLIIAPTHMRDSLLDLIDKEIDHVQNGRPGMIWAKMNALVDREIILKLYEASQLGVQIDLVVRGICCLRPGIEGLSDNIRVKSIIGRFLEHSRIFCFGNGEQLPSKNAKVYISSADWMPRNFDGRVEIMVPLENPTVHAQVLDQIMVACMNDAQQSWHLRPDGTYVRVPPKETNFSAHTYFMTNPSLSGRGKALKKSMNQQGMVFNK
ncbi:MAG: RNA degradosome polyphosphate kinase [Rickettsiales bacterium]